jgi:hypothetical protein
VNNRHSGERRNPEGLNGLDAGFRRYDGLIRVSRAETISGRAFSLSPGKTV